MAKHPTTTASTISDFVRDSSPDAILVAAAELLLLLLLLLSS